MAVNRRFVRGVGLALIVMPEPFTTPLGVALVLIANFIKSTAMLYPRRWMVREPCGGAPFTRVRRWQRPAGLEQVRQGLTALRGPKPNPRLNVCPRRPAGGSAIVPRPLREHAHGCRAWKHGA